MSSKEQTVQKRILRLMMTVFLIFAACFTVASTADTVLAAKAGFVTKAGKTYYRKSNGKYAKGWLTLDGKKYYFNKKTGVMTTGWTKNKRYFDPETGVMATGLTKDSETKKLRYFNPKTGVLVTGWKKINGNKYYFDPKNTGIATTGWTKHKRYFNSKGVMVTGWTSSRRYFNPKTGIMATGWLMLNNEKYYMDPKTGQASTGWTKIDGKWYFFDLHSYQMFKNVTRDGFKIRKSGVASVSGDEAEAKVASLVGSAKVLILSGHGQGDSGATAKIGSKNYQEYLLTREFAKLIYNEFSSTQIRVTLYNQNYDLYQVLTGQKSGPVPNLKDYDYVLEIHFNATDAGYEDVSGDGVYKGCGIMVNSAKSNVTLDKNIVKAITKLGFKTWGANGGLHRSSGLFNAKICQLKGVSYGLLETAFIDDKDDMTFYQNHKEEMAKAVVTVIQNYFAQ